MRAHRGADSHGSRWLLVLFCFFAFNIPSGIASLEKAHAQASGSFAGFQAGLIHLEPVSNGGPEPGHNAPPGLIFFFGVPGSGYTWHLSGSIAIGCLNICSLCTWFPRQMLPRGSHHEVICMTVYVSCDWSVCELASAVERSVSGPLPPSTTPSLSILLPL